MQRYSDTNADQQRIPVKSPPFISLRRLVSRRKKHSSARTSADENM